LNKDDSGPMPKRPMRFQFELISENGEKLADQYKGAVEKFEGVNLNYSIESLEFVNIFLQKFRDQGLTTEDFAETIFIAGCYVGQVMVINHHGQWINEKEALLPEGISMMPIVIKLPNGTITDPIAKAFKRFYNGTIDNLAYYYHVFTNNKK